MVLLTSTFNFICLLAQKMTCPYSAHAGTSCRHDEQTLGRCSRAWIFSSTTHNIAPPSLASPINDCQVSWDLNAHYHIFDLDRLLPFTWNSMQLLFIVLG